MRCDKTFAVVGNFKVPKFGDLVWVSRCTLEPWHKGECKPENVPAEKRTFIGQVAHDATWGIRYELKPDGQMRTK